MADLCPLFFPETLPLCCYDVATTTDCQDVPPKLKGAFVCVYSFLSFSFHSIFF